MADPARRPSAPEAKPVADDLTVHPSISAAPGYAAFFLVGPTASGKTAVAHELARAGGMDILSADSMLVYRGMDVGTAKPGAAERREVRYRGLDLVSPDEAFNVGLYLEHARRACLEANRDGRPMLVAGGTGLYIKCLVEGLAPLPAADPELRRRAEQVFHAHGLAALQHMMKNRDPAAYARLADPENPRRLIRALEIASSPRSLPLARTGKPSKVAMVGLKLTSRVLYERITARVEWMYAGGLLNEAEKLKELYPQLSGTASQAIGYREALAVLDGSLSIDRAKQLTITRTRRLAKRQMTWFRHQASVQWIDISLKPSASEVGARVREWWEQHGPTPLHI